MAQGKSKYKNKISDVKDTLPSYTAMYVLAGLKISINNS